MSSYSITIPHTLFRLNTCSFQGSRTIRTEEAVLISLATLSPTLAKAARFKEKDIEMTPKVEFSDDTPSEESSESEGDSNNDSDDDSE